MSSSTPPPSPPLPSNNNDDDLDDLLQEESANKKENHLEMTPLNLDYLTKGQLDVVSSSNNHKNNSGSSPTKNFSLQESSFCLLVQASCTYLAHAHPRLCGVAAICSILLLFFGFWNVVMNPTLSYGNVEHDFSLIQSKFDLTQGTIDHWCLRGDNDSCRCEDPLVPVSRGEFQTWTKAHRANKDILAEIKGKSVKVAFLGESLVEEMNGRWMGLSRGQQLDKMKRMFDKKFSTENGAKGVALGIAGDTSPNVLWRLLHGEMPPWFKPDIWWISLGMNDLGRMQCSEEVVVMGILRVVEEILERQPSAQVVINSMLPMADLRGGIYPHVRDYQDAFGKVKDTRFVKTNVPKPKQNDRALRKRAPPPEEEGEDENNPEKLDKKTLKRYKRKDPTNPLMDPNETRMKKFHMFQKNRLPLWTSIHAINMALKKFCAKHERVTYFDATNIFASRAERGMYMLKSEYISIRGHPTIRGFEKWEDAMLKKLQAMLAEEAKHETMEKKIGDKSSKSSSSSKSSKSRTSSDDKGDVTESSSSESSGK